jgi:outer membrane protein OmpA-like peptidoglycan-associated protein
VTRLYPCPNCDRHVRRLEPICPFCQARLAPDRAPRACVPDERLGRAARLAFSVTLLGASGPSCSSEYPAKGYRAQVPTLEEMPIADAGPEPAEPPPNDGGRDSDGEEYRPRRVVAIYSSTTTLILSLIVFKPGSSKIPKEAEPTLTALVETFASRVTGRIEIQGHSDPSEGGAGKRLSLERAKAVRAALVARGADPARLSTVGYGAKNPIVAPEKDGRSANPRVSFQLLEPQAGDR